MTLPWEELMCCLPNPFARLLRTGKTLQAVLGVENSLILSLSFDFGICDRFKGLLLLYEVGFVNGMIHIVFREFHLAKSNHSIFIEQMFFFEQFFIDLILLFKLIQNSE